MKQMRFDISILLLLPLTLLTGCSGKKTADKDTSAQGAPDRGITAEAAAKSTDGAGTEASAGTTAEGYRDGAYKAQTEPDYEGYFTKAEVTIKDGKITAVDWGIYDSNRNGKPFDEKYEEVFAGNETYMEQSRNDWKGSRTYGPKLIETQDPGEVDAVSGATWTYNKFSEIVNKALNEAEK
ncbi:MAG TPA: FMN-binding protein [Clostridia bacterium]|nr:FMN-binding protein [Clostridia bacterium]